MVGIFDLDDESSSPLLCDESKDLCFDDLDHDHHDDQHHHDEFDDHKEPFFYEIKSQPLMVFPEQSDEAFASMVEREREYLPKDDYLARLRCGELDFNVRGEAFDWIFKVGLCF